jgi:hypothetical protein
MAIVFTLCAAYVAYCLGTNPAGPMTTPDSIRYLEMSPIYPLGYSLFVKLTGARGAIVVQPILFGAALAFLGREIVRLTKRTWLAAAVVAAAMALPQIREFHASILSESLFLSVLIVFLALSVRFVFHPTWHLMVLIAMAAGAGSNVRRTGFALVPVMVLMVLYERRQLRGPQPALFLVSAIAPFVVLFGAEQAAAALVHREAASSLTGRHMFAKAALIDASPAFARAAAGEPATATDALRTALDGHLQNDYAPIREFLASAPADIRGVLSIYYETCLQGGCVDRSRELMPQLNEAEQTKMLGAAGLARIRRAPFGFIELLGRNYLSLWTVDRLRHPDRAERLTAFIAAHRPMPYERQAFALDADQLMAFAPAPRVRYAQWAITVVAVWTGGLAIIGVVLAVAAKPVTPLFALAAIAALTAHGCLLLTATLAAGFARFTLGVWPAIVMASLVGVWSLLPDRSREQSVIAP